MATSSRSAERFKYGICLNDECPFCKEKKVQQIPMRKELICTECGKTLRECPPPTSDGINWKLIGIIAAAVIVLGGAGFGIWKLVGGSKGPTRIKLDKSKLEMVVGEKDLIEPKAEPEGAKATFNFKVTTGTAVEVTSGGEVTAIKPGEAVVTVKCEEDTELRATCKITVKAKEAPVPDETQKQEPEAKEEPAPPVKDEKPAEPTKKEEKKKTTTTTTTVPQPAQSSNGTLRLSYGTYTGQIKGGYPNGQGKLVYNTTRQISRYDNKGRTAQAGESVQGNFKNGFLTIGKHFDAQGNLIESLNIGTPVDGVFESK